MARNIVPRTDKGADLGTPAKKWNTVYADSVIANNVQGENLKAIEQSAGDEITLRLLIASAGSTPMSITVYDDIPITDDLIVPENIELNVKLGGKLSVSATKTLTINGPFSAGLYQVFSGDGSIRFGSGAITEVYPEWWGATTGIATKDSLAAFNSMAEAMMSVGSGLKAVFSSGTYYISDTWLLDHLNNLVFEGTGGIGRYGSGTGTCIQPMDTFSGTEIIKLNNCFSIEGKGMNIYARDPSELNQYNGLVITGDNTPSVYLIKWEKFRIRRALTAIYIGTPTAIDYQFQNCAIRDFNLNEIENIGIHVRSRNVDHLQIENGGIRTIGSGGKGIYLERSGMINIDTVAGSGNGQAGSCFIYRGEMTGPLICNTCQAESIGYHVYDLCVTRAPITNINCVINAPYEVASRTGAPATNFIGGHITTDIILSADNAHVNDYGMFWSSGSSVNITGENSFYHRVREDLCNGTFTMYTVNLAPGAYISRILNIAGADLGRRVEIAAPYDLQGIILTAVCSGPSGVRITLFNPTEETIVLADSEDWRYTIYHDVKIN